MKILLLFLLSVTFALAEDSPKTLPLTPQEVYTRATLDKTAQELNIQYDQLLQAVCKRLGIHSDTCKWVTPLSVTDTSIPATTTESKKSQ